MPPLAIVPPIALWGRWQRLGRAVRAAPGREPADVSLTIDRRGRAEAIGASRLPGSRGERDRQLGQAVDAGDALEHRLAVEAEIVHVLGQERQALL